LKKFSHSIGFYESQWLHLLKPSKIHHFAFQI
jgi:hypothetical protein